MTTVPPPGTKTKEEHIVENTEPGIVSEQTLVIREQPAIETLPEPESVEDEASHPEPVSGTSSTGIAPGKKRYYRFCESWMDSQQSVLSLDFSDGRKRCGYFWL